MGGLVVCFSIIALIATNEDAWNLEIAICAFPIFAAGLTEDLGWPLKPKIRLAVGVLSAGIFVFLKRQYIRGVGIEWLNFALSVTSIAIAFTVFCVVALINALNFIGGINGLASEKTFIASVALMWLASTYGEPNLTLLGAGIFFSVLGVLHGEVPSGMHILG